MSAHGALGESFFTRDALVVAPELLGKLLRAGPVSGRIVEVEAYRADDPASHSFRGETARNRSMFRRGGTLYVYLSYGLHHCANIVTGQEGDGQAVLVRALEPATGLELIAARRPGRDRRLWTNGPGKLCAALAIDRTHDGTDLCHDDWLCVEDDGTAPPADPESSVRIGISAGADRLWRLRAPAHRHTPSVR